MGNKFPLTIRYLAELHLKQGGKGVISIGGSDFRDFMAVIRHEQKQHEKTLIRHLKESVEKPLKKR